MGNLDDENEELEQQSQNPLDNVSMDDVKDAKDTADKVRDRFGKKSGSSGDQAANGGKKAGETGKKAGETGKKAADTGKKAGDAKKTAEGGNKAAEVGKKAGDAKKAADAAKAAKAAGAVGKAAGTAANASLMAGLSYVLLWVAIIVIIIIVVIGLIAFFLLLPGMILEKLKAIGQSIVDAIESAFVGAEDAYVNDKEVLNVLNYLESMGYDLKGYGFLSVDFNCTNQTRDHRPDDEYDEKQGVFRNKNSGEITAALSDIVRTYLISDNYIYTMKNENHNFKKAFSSFNNFFSGNWGTGLISVNYENGIGKTGGSYAGDWDWVNDISVSASDKTMRIRRGLFGSGFSYVYQMDGWAGRYGMPLEFLLSVHLATMMPDLTYDLATTFTSQGDNDDNATDLQILLHEPDSAGMRARYVSEDGKPITYDDICNLVDDGDYFRVFTPGYLQSKYVRELFKTFDGIISGSPRCSNGLNYSNVICTSKDYLNESDPRHKEWINRNTKLFLYGEYHGSGTVGAEMQFEANGVISTINQKVFNLPNDKPYDDIFLYFCDYNKTYGTEEHVFNLDDLKYSDITSVYDYIDEKLKENNINNLDEVYDDFLKDPSKYREGEKKYSLVDSKRSNGIIKIPGDKFDYYSYAGILEENVYKISFFIDEKEILENEMSKLYDDYEQFIRDGESEKAAKVLAEHNEKFKKYNELNIETTENDIKQIEEDYQNNKISLEDYIDKINTINEQINPEKKEFVLTIYRDTMYYFNREDVNDINYDDCLLKTKASSGKNGSIINFDSVEKNAGTDSDGYPQLISIRRCICIFIRRKIYL